ncbi:MAG TPA: hypothetical protein VMU50_07900 [Polyangia bacterium]|nr:hypothetical protein [Polyangia bacterium]
MSIASASKPPSGASPPPPRRVYPFRYAAAYDLGEGTYDLLLEPGPGVSTAIAVRPAADREHVVQAVAAAAQNLFSMPANAVEAGGTITLGETNFLIDLESPGTKRFLIEIVRAGTYVLFAEHLPERFWLRLLDASGLALLPLWERRFMRTAKLEDADP